MNKLLYFIFAVSIFLAGPASAEQPTFEELKQKHNAATGKPFKVREENVQLNCAAATSDDYSEECKSYRDQALKQQAEAKEKAIERQKQQQKDNEKYREELKAKHEKMRKEMEEKRAAKRANKTKAAPQNP